MLLCSSPIAGLLPPSCERSATHRAAGSSGRGVRPLVVVLPVANGPLTMQQPSLIASRRLRVAAAAVDTGSDTSTAEATGSTYADLVATVHTPEELEALKSDHASQLIILMCKAKGCRPCKAFGRKYARFAQMYSDAVFLDIFGDESKDTRKMMIDMQVKATPTFMYYRGAEPLGSHSGISEDKLRAAIVKHLAEGEAGYGAAAAAEEAGA